MRWMLKFTVIGALVTVSVAPALAFQCPSLIKKINDEAGNRFDDAAYQAKQKAAQAEALHKQGKHAESVKAAKEGLALLGMK